MGVPMAGEGKNLASPPSSLLLFSLCPNFSRDFSTLTSFNGLWLSQCTIEAAAVELSQEFRGKLKTHPAIDFLVRGKALLNWRSQKSLWHSHRNPCKFAPYSQRVSGSFKKFSSTHFGKLFSSFSRRFCSSGLFNFFLLSKENFTSTGRRWCRKCRMLHHFSAQLCTAG